MVTAEDIIVLCVSLAFMVAGYVLTTNEAFARHSLSTARGRLWVRLLGERRATKLMTRGFGPFAMLLGIAGIVSIFVRPR